MAARYPLKNALWQNVGDESALPSLLGATKEIWIALRTDGKAGAGTRSDPFDGSTTLKFDAILRGYYIANTTNLTIHLGVGNFTTSGSFSYNETLGYFLLPYWKIIGAGKLLTSVTKTGVPPTWPVGAARHCVFEASIYNLQGDGIEISDLTINCNWPAVSGSATNKAVDAIHIPGSNSSVRRVHISNAYGNLASGMEGFAVLIEPSTNSGDSTVYDLSNAVIEDCTADTFQGDYGAAFVVAPFTGAGVAATNVTNAVVRHNAAYNWSTVGGIIYAPLTEDNFTYNCNNPIRLDTVVGTNQRNVFRNNTFLKVTGSAISVPVALGGGDLSSLDVTGNRIDLGNGGAGISISGTAGQHVQNATVARNRISASGNGTVALYFAGVQGLKLGENDLALGLKTVFDDSTAAGVTTFVRPDPRDNYSTTLGASVKLTGTYNSTSDYLFYKFDPSNYTIVAGDRLHYEVLSDDSNTVCKPQGWLYFTDTTDSQLAVDQNGISLGLVIGTGISDISNFARGRWYSRDIDLTAYIGKTADLFEIGEGGTNATNVGTTIHYFRNIKIVSKTGVLRKSYYKDGDAAPAYLFSGGTTSYSASIVAPGGVPSIASTTLVLKGDNAGNAVAATLGTDYLSSASNLNAANLASNLVPSARLGTGGTGGGLKALFDDQTFKGVTGSTIPSTAQVLIGDGAGNATTTTETGTGNTVRATSPTFTTPVLGVAAATSVNKWGFTAPATAATLVAGGDSKTYTFPQETTNVGYREIPQNSQSAAYTTVLADNGKEIFHPAADANARTFTIDSNANVAQPIGAVHVFTNLSANNVTIAITTDTLILLGAGSTGSRTLAQYGQAVARKVASTTWVIAGVNLT